jgi:hypothetical protein
MQWLPVFGSSGLGGVCTDEHVPAQSGLMSFCHDGPPGVLPIDSVADRVAEIELFKL